uniref:DUF4283 domain-containing protein n=1 Tax=Davidia involucrata TaxID=16924 RepID=A0A5B7BKB9_DAVIN
MENCLVGRVGTPDGSIPESHKLQKWVDSKWGVPAGVSVLAMHGALFMFVFPSIVEASRILRNRDWTLDGAPVFLDRWVAASCCLKPKNTPREIWVRFMGLPAFLWYNNIFKALGNHCGGYVETATKTKSRDHLRWARVKVRVSANPIPSSMKIKMGSWGFEVPV